MKNQENNISEGQGSSENTLKLEYNDTTVKELKAILKEKGTDFDPKANKKALFALVTGKEAPTAPVVEVKVKDKISTQAEAEKFAKDFKLPKGDKLAFVTSDGYLFHEGSHGSALGYAKRKGKKVFTIK